MNECSHTLDKVMRGQNMFDVFFVRLPEDEHIQVLSIFQKMMFESSLLDE